LSNLFSINQPKLGTQGQSFVLQGPVDSSVDVIHVQNEYESLYNNDGSPFAEIFIPKSRFFSNRGLRWYTEMPVDTGKNTFNIRAGIQESLSGTEHVGNNHHTDVSTVDRAIGGYTDLVDGGDWTTDISALTGFSSINDTWDLQKNSEDTITSYFLYTFTIPNTIKLTAATLNLTFNDAIQVYLDGSSMYMSPQMPAAGWVYANQATSAVSSTTIATSISTTLLSAGTHILAVAHKRASTQRNVNLSLKLNLDFKRVKWTNPQQISINISETQILPSQNFNHLDEWGMIYKVERFPGEYNSPYKYRMQKYVASNFDSTTNGIIKGSSARLGLPEIEGAVNVLIRGDENSSNESTSVADDLILSIANGKLSLTSSLFSATSEPTVNEDYMIIEPSGKIADITSFFGKSFGELDPRTWEIDDDGNIRLYREIDPFGYQLDYYIAHEYDLFNKTILDVVTWLNNIAASGVNASGDIAPFNPFNASASTDAKFLSYSGEIVNATSGALTVYSSGELDEFNGEEKLFFNITGDEHYYPIDSIDGSGITLETEYVGTTASGGSFEFSKTIDAKFIPSMQISPIGHFTLPVYQMMYRPFMSQDWDAFNSIDDPETASVMSHVSKVENSVRSSWNEVIADVDIWDVIDEGMAGGSEIPNIYDGPKTIFRASSSGQSYTPEEALASGYADTDGNDILQMFLSPKDFQSGVDMENDSLSVHSIVESSTATTTTSGEFNFSVEWQHSSMSGNWGLGCYFDKAFYRCESEDFPISGSGQIGDLGPSGELGIYITESGGITTFGHTKFNEDYNNHIVGIPSNTESEEMFDMVMDRSDEDWQQGAFKDLLISYGWQEGQIIIGDFADNTGNLLLLVNATDGKDVIKDGPLAVLRIKNVVQ